jgi:hypothetical protein
MLCCNLEGGINILEELASSSFRVAFYPEETSTYN